MQTEGVRSTNPLPSGIDSLLILVIGYDTIPFGNENMEEYCGAA